MSTCEKTNWEFQDYAIPFWPCGLVCHFLLKIGDRWLGCDVICNLFWLSNGIKHISGVDSKFVYQNTVRELLSFCTEGHRLGYEIGHRLGHIDMHFTSNNKNKAKMFTHLSLSLPLHEIISEYFPLISDPDGTLFAKLVGGRAGCHQESSCVSVCAFVLYVYRLTGLLQMKMHNSTDSSLKAKRGSRSWTHWKCRQNTPYTNNNCIHFKTGPLCALHLDRSMSETLKSVVMTW